MEAPFPLLCLYQPLCLYRPAKKTETEVQCLGNTRNQRGLKWEMNLEGSKLHEQFSLLHLQAQAQLRVAPGKGWGRRLGSLFSRSRGIPPAAPFPRSPCRFGKGFPLQCFHSSGCFKPNLLGSTALLPASTRQEDAGGPAPCC